MGVIATRGMVWIGPQMGKPAGPGGGCGSGSEIREGRDGPRVGNQRGQGGS